MSNTPLALSLMPDPNNDGLDHINVYSKGRTQLGQLLSNFSHVAFNHPQYGFFASMEAYWYWLSTGKKHDSLRRLYGATAKTAGIRLNPVKIDETEFVNLIADGLRLKIAQNPKLREAVKKSTLPFRHYFVYGTSSLAVREPRKHMWQMECLENIRKALQEGRGIRLSDGSPAETQTIREIIEDPTPSEFALPED